MSTSKGRSTFGCSSAEQAHFALRWDLLLRQIQWLQKNKSTSNLFPNGQNHLKAAKILEKISRFENYFIRSTYPWRAFSPNQSPFPRVRRKTGSSLGESSRVTFTCGKAKTPQHSGNFSLTTQTSLFREEFVTSWISQERLLWEPCNSPESCTLPLVSPANHPRKWVVIFPTCFGFLGMF